MQKLATLKARLKTLMMMGGDPKQRTKEAAAISRQIAAAPQAYAQAGGDTSTLDLPAAASGTEAAPASDARWGRPQTRSMRPRPAVMTVQPQRRPRRPFRSRLDECAKNGTRSIVVDRTKRLQARFYETAGGVQPVRDWLIDLDDADRRTVGKDIAKVEFGWPIGLPSCRPLGKGLYEVRNDLSDGRIGRVLFGIVTAEMVLLHGFVKKTQKTPAADLELARKRLKEVT